MGTHERNEENEAALTGSRANALKHGLASRSILPPQLAQRRDEFLEEFNAELEPCTALERLFVEELSRHAAGLELATNLETIALRVSPQLPGLASLGSSNELTPAEQGLLVTMTGDVFERTIRYRRGHERALYSALRALQACRQTPVPASQAKTDVFASENNCKRFLYDLKIHPSWPCPQCRGHHHRWLARRERLECVGCGWQSGLRAGTILARSRLPLNSWFCGIIALAEQPELALEQLAARTNLHRHESLTKLQKTILGALAQPRTDRLVCALVEFIGEHHRAYASSQGWPVSGQNDIRPDRRPNKQPLSKRKPR